MVLVDCPSCQKRLRAPEGTTAATLRCPTCKHVFRYSGNGNGNGNGKAQEPAAVPAGSGLSRMQEEKADSQAVPELSQKALSDADESMLRDFGAGSGLLELTREAYEVSGATGRAERKESGAGKLSALGGVEPSLPEIAAAAAGGSDRQFQVVATALTLANRLVLTYKGELARARQMLTIGLGCIGLLVLLGATALWWGTSKSGSLEGERKTAGMLDQRGQDLDRQLAESRKDMENNRLTLQKELDAARQELEKERNVARDFQAKIDKANEAVLQATTKANDAVLQTTTTISGLANQVKQLSAELDKYRATTRPEK